MKNLSRMNLSDVVVLDDLQMKLVNGGLDTMDSEASDPDGGGGKTGICNKPSCKKGSDCSSGICGTCNGYSVCI